MKRRLSKAEFDKRTRYYEAFEHGLRRAHEAGYTKPNDLATFVLVSMRDRGLDLRNKKPDN